MYVSAVSYIEEKESKGKERKGKEEKRNAKGINRREGRRMKSYSSQFHSPIFKISVWLYFKETVSRHCACTKSCAKITTTTNTNISLLGSQAVKLMSQQQIAGIGEDLQYFWQILILSAVDINQNLPVSAAFTSVWLTSKTCYPDYAILGQWRQHQEARKIFLRNPRILLSISLLWLHWMFLFSLKFRWL